MLRNFKESEDKIILVKLYNNSNSFARFIPYIVNGNEYLFKLVKKSETGNDILGYANPKEPFSFIHDKLELTSGDGVDNYLFRKGYFQPVIRRRKGEYEVFRQITSDNNKVYEDFIKAYDFIPYNIPLTNENILEKNIRERKEKEEKLRKRREENERLLETSVAQYVMNSDDSRIRSRISSLMHLWPKLERELVVYRGQKDPMIQYIRTKPNTFFSTSLDWNTAYSTFTSENVNCCLFVLHIKPGVRYYNVSKTSNNIIELFERSRLGNEKAINKLEDTSRFEDEILVEGNGRFFLDPEGTIPGFREMSSKDLETIGIGISEKPITHKRNGKEVSQTTGVFEAYYFPPQTEGGKRKKTRKFKSSKRKATRRR